MTAWWGQVIGRVVTEGAKTASSSSRLVAKDRLRVILATQRGSELLAGVNMDALQTDVLDVVKKHVLIARDRPVNIQFRTEGEVSLMEMSVELNHFNQREEDAPMPSATA
eukprot:CAMPEP_0118707498 /NCGR_PEP_ID=MMETSP0800-20121206/21253_1 /TAXON_ID=210618 ORGANISM="Striatella unipunctata, Strain CCMP2910" /NCGR_SAMPLE_ID=MMETSP0800 /ASSEMBLY_ACC=CAM_ASM_000638 /LENGTH=109 /DNA_ID=CAMNT_0006610363 /DNA_START=39 /DNA_END=368 /DNA_ORIENTATION=+